MGGFLLGAGWDYGYWLSAIGFRCRLAGGRCNYYRCGHCVSGGWQRGFRDADHFLACVCNGGGNAVAAGSTNVALGANGALNVSLVPNSGATPAGVYYSVVYQLGPGQVKTEDWIVPTTSPAKLSAVRSTPGAGLAAQPVSLQYVNSELATKADDTSVVHLNGAETISGNKTFASAPTVPAPASAGQIANKAMSIKR